MCELFVANQGAITEGEPSLGATREGQPSSVELSHMVSHGTW